VNLCALRVSVVKKFLERLMRYPSG
jgi:hypothetical protein